MNNIQHFFVCPKADMLPRWREAFPDAVCDAPPPATDRAGVLWLRLDPALPASEQVAQARQRHASGPLVVLSDMPTDAEAMAVFAAGAKGYCNAHASADFLRQVASVVEQGGLWIGEALMQRLLALAGKMPVQKETDPAWESILSEREREVAREVCRGASNKEIARQLGITERTVKMHVSAIFSKLKVRDRLQLSILLKT